MPKYRAKVRILLGHESRVIEEGGEFTTVFPKAKVDGKLVDMKLGANLELIGYTDEEAAAIAAEAKAEPAAEAEAVDAAPAKTAPVSRAKQ